MYKYIVFIDFLVGKVTGRSLYLPFLLLLVGLWIFPGQLRAQLYVGENGIFGQAVRTYDPVTGAPINSSFINGVDPSSILLSGNVLFMSDGGGDEVYSQPTICTYDATTGAALNPSFVVGAAVRQIVLVGNTLYVLTGSSIATYDATTGQVINPALITGLSMYGPILISGNDIFISSIVFGTVARYNATTGALVTSSFIGGLVEPAGMAVLNNKLLVASFGTGTIGEYDANTGRAINANFIDDPDLPVSLDLSGNDLYVLNGEKHTVGEYDATTGAAINPDLITFSNTIPTSLLVVPTPEPGGGVLLALGGAVLLGRHRRRLRSVGHSAGAVRLRLRALVHPFFLDGLHATTAMEIISSREQGGAWQWVAGAALVGRWRCLVCVASSGQQHRREIRSARRFKNAYRGSFLRRLILLILSAAALGPAILQAQQIYVTGGIYPTSYIGEYDANTGAPVSEFSANPYPNTPVGAVVVGNTLYTIEGPYVCEYDATMGAFLNYFGGYSSLIGPEGLVIANNIAYVSSTNGSYITEFDATTGAVLNKYFISEASVPSLGYAADPKGLLYSNNILYVANYGANAVSTFDATTGALLNANFAPGVQEPWSLAIRGNDLFVANWRGGTVGEYDATTGAVIDANFITDLGGPELALSGNDLFVSNWALGTVGEYDATSGAPINATLLTGLNRPEGLAVTPAPEPASAALLAVGAAMALGCRRRRG
jgi:hypothetical protein